MTHLPPFQHPRSLPPPPQSWASRQTPQGQPLSFGPRPRADPLAVSPASGRPHASSPSPSGPAPPAEAPPTALRPSPAPHSPEAAPRALRLGCERGDGIGGDGGGAAGVPHSGPGSPVRGEWGSLRRWQPGRSRVAGAQRRWLHIHQQLHLKRDGPPCKHPPITAVSPPLNNFRSHYQATGDVAEHRAPPSQGNCWGKKGEELGESS